MASPVDEPLRPHWSQAGTIAFVTFRESDSIPRDVIECWDRQKRDWLSRRELIIGRHWSDALPTLDDRQRLEFDRHFDRLREEYLNTFRGRCLLRRPALSRIVADSLLHFDGELCRIGDFVVMPNHVHLLAAFPEPDAMDEQINAWLHFAAFRIRQATGEVGHSWRQEPLDHLVRDKQDYDELRRYIADYPREANLKPGEYVYRQG
jgi:type I restriction enzyme R subunit